MTETEIKEIVQKQRSYFYTGATLPVEKRLDALKKLKTCIQKYEPLINEALKRDLGKSNFESYMCEVGLVLSELSYMIRHTPSYAKEKTVLTPLAQFASRSYKKPSPYGVVLVMSPWNYPFLLTIDPLIDAIAAGNTVVLKPSAYSPHTSRVIETIITECFDPQYVAVVNGGRAENNTLLNEHFDYIFFTGSQHVGREVMAKASVHLTPVTLELGGKSPCIVEKSANLKLAARRIVFGKYLNCGQTCVAPDYIYCDREIKDELIRQIQKQIRKQFGSTPLNNKNYGKIINEFKYENEKVISCDFIKETIAKYFSINKDDLSSNKRSNDIAFPRQIAMFLCREIANMSYPQIGEDFGGRDHSTVMHACRKIEKEVKEKTNTKLIVDSVKNIIVNDKKQ